MKKLVIFGQGDIAEVAHFYFTHDSEYEVVAFTVDQEYRQQLELLGLPVVSFEEVQTLYSPQEYDMFVAIGYKGLNRLREGKYHQAKAKGYRLATYLSSKATHWGDTQIGDNCFILEDITLQPFVTIGNNVVMWSGNHVGHHTTIGNHCFITSHVVISGGVTVGDYSFIGVNATLRDHITIGPRCLIGAGTLILKSTQEGEVYMGQRTQAAEMRSDEIKNI